jgi:hypothetical protein
LRNCDFAGYAFTSNNLIDRMIIGVNETNSLIIEGCSFHDNRISDSRLSTMIGLHMRNGSIVRLINSRFYNNTMGYVGGHVVITGAAHVMAMNIVVSNNHIMNDGYDVEYMVLFLSPLYLPIIMVIIV